MWENQQEKEVCLKKLQDCELFRDNEVNNDGDFVYFALMAEFEPVKLGRGFKWSKMNLYYEGGDEIYWEEQ